MTCSDSDSLAKALGDGLARAAAAVDSGATADLLDRWTQASNRLATPRPRAVAFWSVAPCGRFLLLSGGGRRGGVGYMAFRSVGRRFRHIASLVGHGH